MKTPYPIALAWLFLTALVVVGPAYSGEWILDDRFLIETNDYLREPGAWSRWFFTDMWDVTSEKVQGAQRLSYFRPIPMVSYHWDWAIGGGEPVAFHITNAVLHGVAGLMVVKVSRHWVPRRAAILAGFLFVVHPAKVENVAWISGRTDLLCALGLLLVIDGFLSCSKDRKRGWVRQIAGVLLAYLSKEHAVVLPGLVLFCGWASRSGTLTWKSLRDHPFVLRGAAIHLAVAGCYLGLRRALLPLRTFDVKGLGVAEHALLIVESLGRALECWFVPARLALSVSSLEKTPEGLALRPVLLAVGILGVVLAVAVFAFFRKRRPRFVGAIGLFFFLLAPTLNIVWSGGMHVYTPRFLYIPSLALSFAVASLVAKKRQWRRAVISLVVVFAALSWWRAGHFSSAEAFYAYEFESNPRDPMNVQRQISLDRKLSDPTLAFRRTLCGHRYAATHYVQRRKSEKFLLDALELAVRHTPDHQRDFLLNASAFLQRWVDGRGAQLGPPFDVTLHERRGGPPSPSLRVRILLLQAEIGARLGRAREALSALREAHQACPQCALVAKRAPLLARRAEVRSLEDTESNESLARHQAKLGNYGRAVEVLRAELGERSRQQWVRLGEMAARAGDADLARDALGKAGYSPSLIESEIKNVQAPLRFLRFPLDTVSFEPGGCRTSG